MFLADYISVIPENNTVNCHLNTVILSVIPDLFAVTPE